MIRNDIRIMKMDRNNRSILMRAFSHHKGT